MKILLILTILILQSCVTMGPDYGSAKRFCKKQKSEFREGNPIYFSCKDGTEWERSSNGYKQQETE